MTSTGSLRGSREFRRVYERGRATRGRGVIVYLAPGPNPVGAARVGLAVRLRRTRRGRAVTRNRIKRRLRHVLGICPPPGGYDVVIAADESASEVEFQELADDVCRAIARAAA